MCSEASKRRDRTGAVFVVAALAGLADEHGTDAEAHDEEAAEAVEKVDTALELGAIRVDDGDSDDADEAIEGVEGGIDGFVAVDHDDAEDDLDEHSELHNGGVPPKGPGAKRDEFVGGEGPDAGEGVADDDDPRKIGVEIVEGLSVHGEFNLPDDCGGFGAGFDEGEVVVGVDVKCGDGAVVEIVHVHGVV